MGKTIHLPVAEWSKPLDHPIGFYLSNFLESKGYTNLSDLFGVRALKKREKLPLMAQEALRKIADNAEDFLNLVKNIRSQKRAKENNGMYDTNWRFNCLRILLPMYSKCSQKSVLNFFGCIREREIKFLGEKLQKVYSQHNPDKGDPISLAGLSRYADLVHARYGVHQKYNEKKIFEWIGNREWTEHIGDVEYLTEELPELFSEYGVQLIFAPYLRNSVFNMVKWEKGTPIILITDKYKNIVTCWYSLFHSLGHILLHPGEDFLCNQTGRLKYNDSFKEFEANQFIKTHLFNGGDFIQELYKSYEFGVDVSKMAEKYNVHPLFIRQWFRSLQDTEEKIEVVSVDFSNRPQNYYADIQDEGNGKGKAKTLSASAPVANSEFEVYYKVIARVKTYLKENNITQKSLSDATEIPAATLSRILSLNKIATTEQFIKMINHCDFDVVSQPKKR